jgi:hypothetical protein
MGPRKKTKREQAQEAFHLYVERAGLPVFDAHFTAEDLDGVPDNGAGALEWLRDALVLKCLEVLPDGR